VKHYIIFALVPLILSLGIIPAFASEENSQLPEWVKNNARWWAEGKISEQEYINSIQFLIDQGIISVGESTMLQSVPSEKNIPKEKVGGGLDKMFQSVPFARNIPQDDDRVQFYAAKLSGGDLPDTHVFFSIGKFKPGEDPIFLKSLRQQGFNSYFILENLPNKELTKPYEIVSRYINPGKPPQLFDVSIMSFSGDGTPIVNIKYTKCKLTEFITYLQDSIYFFQLNKKFESEIRERSVFQCGGLKIEPNPNPPDIDYSKLGMIPNDSDIAQKFVVHFFNGDLNQIYSTTFAKYSPSVDTTKTPFVSGTSPGNPIGSNPQFFLEGLPSIDKQGYYEMLSRYVNPVRIPELFDVSIDLITGDNTILQRWNYVKCKVTSYSMGLHSSLLQFTFADQISGEIRDKTDFECSGTKFRAHGVHQIEKLPIKDRNYKQADSEYFDLLYTKDFPSKNDRAMSYTIRVSGGEFTATRTSDDFPIFGALVQDRGSLTPVNSAKQYDVGFYLEGLPGKGKEELYNFFARYVNPGKTPEPFDVDVDVVTGDGIILETLQYRSCSGIDVDWYTQDLVFLYQITGKVQEEIRERYTFYCDGYRIEVPNPNSLK